MKKSLAVIKFDGYYIYFNSMLEAIDFANNEILDNKEYDNEDLQLEISMTDVDEEEVGNLRKFKICGGIDNE